MQKFQHSSQTYCSGSTAVGLVLLQTDEVLESEIRILPTESVFYPIHVPSGTQVTLAKMEAEILAAIRLFPPVTSLRVIAYCCTSGTTVIGEDKVAAAYSFCFP